MAFSFGQFLRFFFWIKLVPVRRLQIREEQAKGHLSHTGSNVKNYDSKGGWDAHKKAHLDKSDEIAGWEWDLCSIRFILLMLTLLAADAVYIVLTLSIFTNSEMALFNITILVFKLLNMTPSITVPWLLGPAVCRLGSWALPLGLVVSRKDLISPLVSLLGLTVGVVCIHAHAVAENMWYLASVAVSSCLSGLCFAGLMCAFFAWLQDFQKAAKATGQRAVLSADEADAVLARFEQLKLASGEMVFVLMALAQVVQIFSLYNVMTGEICCIYFKVFHG